MTIIHGPSIHQMLLMCDRHRNKLSQQKLIQGSLSVWTMQSKSIISFSKIKPNRYLWDSSDSFILERSRYQSYSRRLSPLGSLPMDTVGLHFSPINRHIRSITVAQDYEEEPIPPMVAYRNHSRSPRQKIDEMHSEEILRKRAKHFITKIRKQKEYIEGKLMLKRKQEEIKRLERIRYEQELERQMNEKERLKRRIAAEERILDNYQRNQLREENRYREKSDSRRKSSQNNLISKSVRLHPIKQKGAKSSQQSQYSSSKLKTQPTATMAKSNRKERLPVIPLRQPVPKVSHRSNSKIDEKLQKSIYLTVQEGRKIDEIKKKIDQLNKLG